MAFSLASAPPFVKKTLWKPVGARPMMRFAASPRARFTVDGAIVVSRSACSWIACDDGRVLVADVDVHELAREVEVLAPGVVPDAASEAAGDDERRQLPLRRPGVEDVVAVERRARARRGPRRGSRSWLRCLSFACDVCGSRWSRWRMPRWPAGTRRPRGIRRVLVAALLEGDLDRLVVRRRGCRRRRPRGSSRACSTYSFVYAVSGGSVVMTWAPSWFLVPSAISTVASHAASLMWPMPFGGRPDQLVDLVGHPQLVARAEGGAGCGDRVGGLLRVVALRRSSPRIAP